MQVVGHEAGVDGGPRGAHRSADEIGELVEELEVLTALHATTYKRHRWSDGDQIEYSAFITHIRKLMYESMYTRMYGTRAVFRLLAIIY